MTIRRVVVDTSALIDAVDADYPDWGEAFAYLQGTYPTQAPRLLEAEAGNVVHVKHPGAFGDTVEERCRVHEDLLEGVDPVDPSPRSRERCGELVEQIGLTYYDVCVLEVAARSEDRLLLTQDRGMLEAGRALLGPDRALDLDGAAEEIAAGEL